MQLLKGNAMYFTRGDNVVHQNFGVGTVAHLETKSVGEERRLFYRVVFPDTTTIWVPVNEAANGAVRPVTPQDELARYRDLLNSPPAALDEDFRRRLNELEQLYRSGTLESVCVVVRDLTARLDRKPLNNSERKLYRRSCNSLIAEWSVSSGKSLSEAQREIERCLRCSEGLLSTI